MITYCRQTFNRICQSIGADDIQLEFTDSNKIGYNHSIKTIFIGRQYLDDITVNGFKDYRSLQYIWTQNGYDFIMYDKQAVWATLIHEFAHYLQDDRNHSVDFKNKLGMLIEWIPFDYAD
jgi:hypothetical protein